MVASAEQQKALVAQYTADDAMCDSIYGSSNVKTGASSTKNFALAKVTIANFVNTKRGNLESSRTVVATKYDTLKNLYKGIIGEDEPDASLTEAMADIYAKKRIAMGRYGTVSDGLKTMGKDIEDASDIEGVQLIRSNVNELMSSHATAPCLKELVSTMQTFTNNLSEHRTSLAPRPAAGPVAADLPPILAAVVPTVQQLGDTVSRSFYEAKAGMKAARVMLPISGPAAIMNSAKLAVVEKVTRDLAKHIKTASYGTAPFDMLAKETKVSKFLRQAFDHQLFTRHPLPTSSPWASKVYQAAPFVANTPWFHVGYPSFGCMERRLITEGCLYYIGIATENVPGETIKEKRRSMIQGDKESLSSLVQQHGWCVKLCEGECLVVPTGFLIIGLCLQLRHQRSSANGTAADETPRGVW